MAVVEESSGSVAYMKIGRLSGGQQVLGGQCQQFQVGHDTSCATGLLLCAAFADSIQESVYRSSSRALDVTSKKSFILFATSVASFARLMCSGSFRQFNVRIYVMCINTHAMKHEIPAPTWLDHFSYGNHYERDSRPQLSRADVLDAPRASWRWRT